MALEHFPRIPTYLSHSYRAPDRDVNQFFHDLFWEQGFAFTVDPKSHALSTTHLEMMMRNSACFVAVVTRRDEQPHYRCSPFIVYEYGMAVQAHKPRLVLVEANVPRRCFPEEEHTLIFNRNRLHAASFENRIKLLAEESHAYVNVGNRPLGDVGLLLPDTPEYAEAAPMIKDVLHEAGYTPISLALDRMDGATAAHALDRVDFVVMDVGSSTAAGLALFVQGRFVPSVKLVFHQPGQAPTAEVPRLLLDRALETASAAKEVAIWWSSPQVLEVELRKQVQSLHAPRREFLSKVEGEAYFNSLGRPKGSVFLSTAQEDSDLARDIVRQMQCYNIHTFHYLYKNTLPVGEYWKPSLLRRIEESEIFAPVLSRAYWRSTWCRREYAAALELHRAGRLKVVPYVLEDSEDCDVEVQGMSLFTIDPPDRAGRIAAHLDEQLLRYGGGDTRPSYSVGRDEQPVPEVDIPIVTALDEEYAARHVGTTGRRVRCRVHHPVDPHRMATPAAPRRR